MKLRDTEDSPLTMLSIVGYCTEMTLWNYVHDIAECIKEKPVKIDVSDVWLKDSEFELKSAQPVSQGDAIWYLGCSLYYLATGLPPFGAADLCELQMSTPVPVISPTHYSETLCNLVSRCMTMDTSGRPDIDEIIEISKKQIQIIMKRRTDHSELRVKVQQKASVLNDKVHFWKESMVTLLLIVMFSIPVLNYAQDNPEMDKIVRLTQSLRQSSNRQTVLNELMNDTQWTLMDELKFHSNECSYSDKVSMFGMNDIAREIARKEKGIVNHGNRFKHSADDKHPYSFVELTVKKGMEVSYMVEKHAGTQYIIVVPFDAKQAYTVKGNGGTKGVVAQKKADGNMYMTLTPDSKGSYTFSITNDGKKNAAFVVITYNSKK